MTFRRYDHLERLGHREVAGIELGLVHVFPKLDGTNASVWAWQEAGGLPEIRCGSRNNVLAEGRDNHGFREWVMSDDSRAVTLRRFLLDAPEGLVLYGEWLVPHTLKTYRAEAWRRFWIFDVFNVATGKYLPWEDYGPMLMGLGLDVVEPLCVFTNPSPEQLRGMIDKNLYLIADGAGLGEGVVIKNYFWKNAFGRQPWAKVVRNEFREKNLTAFGVSLMGGEFQVELAIVEEFVTQALVDKTRAKIVSSIAEATGVEFGRDEGTIAMAVRTVEGSWRHKLIPALLSRVFHDLVVEEMWGAVKKHRLPVVDFKKLERACTVRVKALAADLF